MPASPEAVPDGDAATRNPTLIAHDGDLVGFLDAPGLDLHALVAAIEEAIGDLDIGSVLTVYNDHPSGRSAIEGICTEERLALIGEISHPSGGMTYMLRLQC